MVMNFLRFSRFCLIGMLFLCAVITSDAVESDVVSVGDQTFLIRTWQVGAGLPFNQVRDVLQTRDGFIWVATLNGAARFDGVDFEHIDIRTAPNLPDNQIVKLYEDRSDHLYLGHATGHISVFAGNETITLACPGEWIGQAVTEFFEKPDGSVWAENAGGALLQVGEGGTPLALPRLPEEDAAPILKPMAGWMARDDRVVKLDASGAELEAKPAPWPIKNQSIHLLERRNDDLVGGSTFGGIFIMHGGSSNVTQITVSDGLASIEVLCLAEDAEQTLWVGTTAGLQSIRAMDYTSVPESAFRGSWEFRALRSITPRLAGGVWLGTSKGQLWTSDGKVLKRVPSLNKSEKIRRAILETQDGPVWINDDSGFMLRLNGKVLSTRKAKKAGESEIWTIQQAADGRLWAGGRNGVWENPDHMGWHLAAGRRKGISDVQCLATSSNGTLWIGMESSGLAAWKDDEILRWSTDAGLPNPHVTALCIDKDDDSVWIGSCGNGLISFRDGVFREVPFTQNIVSHIMDDGKGRLWVVGEQGLAIVEKKEVAHALRTGEEIQTYILYGEEEGLNPPIDISSGLSTACLTPDGRFWYASDRQLAVFQPSEVQLWTNPVPLVINHAQVHDQTLLLHGVDSMVLDPGVHRLDIHFSALSFVSPSHMRFRCRLLGLGDEWSELGTRRIASFQRLPPGKYTFQLIAANRDGLWNPAPTQVNIIVKPFLWETWWFKALMYLSIGLLAALLSLAVADRINRKKLIRSEQLRAVEEERTRIAMDIHDEIGSELTRMQLLCHRIFKAWDKSGSDSGPAEVGEMEHVINKLVRAFDEIVWVVSPGNDNVDNLVGYLSKYVSSFLGSAHISCDLDIPLELPSLPVPGPVRHNLFLAIKEGLNNTVKHAEATQVCFSVAFQSEGFVIALHDNGKGVEAQEGERFHRGLRSMRRRMELVDGQFDIHNNERGGTTVEFKLPIREDASR